MERKWQMTRLGAGDYLLPSNDKQMFWRITRYEERDGTLTRGDGTVVNGDFWKLYRWAFGGAGTLSGHDIVGWDHWHEEASMFPTRQATIDYAMQCEPRQVASR